MYLTTELVNAQGKTEMTEKIDNFIIIMKYFHTLSKNQD